MDKSWIDMPRFTTEYFDGLNLDDYLSYVLKQEGSERFFAWEIEKGCGEVLRL